MTASRNRATVTQPIRIVRADRNGRAAAGFWLGVLGLLVGWFPVLGLLVTVPAWVLSRAGRARFRRGLAGAPAAAAPGWCSGSWGA